MALETRIPKVRISGRARRVRVGAPPRVCRAGIAAVLGIALSLAGPAPASPAGTDESAPMLSEHRGDVMLLHFWATWCEPCAEELVSLSSFYEGPYRELSKRGLVLVTVSNDVRSKDLDTFLAARQLPFPVIVDSLSELNEKLGLAGIPGTVVIDRNGRVVERFVGAQDWQSPEFLSRLEGFLARWSDGAVQPVRAANGEAQ